jgi:hypothetical protein
MAPPYARDLSGHAPLSERESLSTTTRKALGVAAQWSCFVSPAARSANKRREDDQHTRRGGGAHIEIGSFDLFEFLQRAQVGGMWFPRVNLRPRGPGNLADIDVAARVDCETVRRQELAEFGPGRRVAEAADQLAFMIDDAARGPRLGMSRLTAAAGPTSPM